MVTWCETCKQKTAKHMQTQCNISEFSPYHESLLNAKVVMDDFGQRSQAVGGTGGVTERKKENMLSLSKALKMLQVDTNINWTLPDNGHGGRVVFVLVHSHDEHGGIRRGGGHNHALCAPLDVELCWNQSKIAY